MAPGLGKPLTQARRYTPRPCIQQSGVPAACLSPLGRQHTLPQLRRQLQPPTPPTLDPSQGQPPGEDMIERSTTLLTGSAVFNFDESMPARQTNSNGPERLCCPVASCPCSDAACIPKWSEAVLSKHVDAHLSGQLAGRVPAQWLSDRGKIQCRVCGLGVSSRLEVHPTCRPAERRQRRPEQQASSDGATQLMPTLSSMCDGSARTLKYVPAKAKTAWAKALVRSLAFAVHCNTVAAWTEFAMLPACTLCPPPLHGRSSSADTAAFTLDRLSRWEAGERMSLWSDRVAPRSASTRAEQDDEHRKFLRAEVLCREGLVGKACAALVSDGICAPSNKSLADIVALHPSAALPDLPPGDHAPPALVLEAGAVSKCLRSFPKGQQLDLQA